MNHYYTNYQHNDFSHTSPDQWKKYGIESFRNLLYFLGYPKVDDLNYLGRFAEYKEFESGEILQKQDEPCHHFYFIIKGAVKITSLKSAYTTTFALFNEGNLAGSIFDFFEGTPSAYTIETCSYTHCLAFSKSSYLILAEMMDTHGLTALLNQLHQNFLKYVMWFQGYGGMPAMERIKDLYHKFPEIIHEFKDGDVASFLGMRRETYNKMKKDLFRQ